MQTSNNQVQSSYIPSEAYLFFPRSKNFIIYFFFLSLLVDTSKYPKVQRSFFDGNIQFTVYEHEMINNFRSYAAKQNYTLKSLWTDNMILRFLYANSFKMNKTLSSVQVHTIWRETNLPVPIDESLQTALVCLL